MSFLELDGRRIEYEFIDIGTDTGETLVFLHEGLGSVALWKDFPRQLATAAGCNALVYSRTGYGHSSALTARREPDFMHDEALAVLPRILDFLKIEAPILFGHSDGGSIALIYAGSSGRRVEGLILLAPHVMVEPVCIQSIATVKQTYETTNLRDKLRRYHADPDGAFRGWCDIWLDPRFLQWNIEDHVRGISCPILAIQGIDDQYGTMEQIDRIARLVPRTNLVKLPACGHSPHRDHPDAVTALTTRYIDILKSSNTHSTGHHDSS